MRPEKFAAAILTSLVLSASSFATAQEQGKNADPELQKFQGSWVMTSAKMDGKKVSKDHIKQNKLTFDGDKAEIYSPHQHKEVMIATITKLDATKKPKEMEWVRASGPSAGATMFSIYRFKGADQYTVCFHPTSASAPAKFSSEPGSGNILQTWKRVKK